MTAPHLVAPHGTPGLFSSFGEQLLAIRDAELQYNAGRREVDSRLILLQQRALPAGASESVPADGGFLVQPEFSRALVKRMYNTGQILRRCTQMPITGSNGLRFPQYDETSRANGSRLGGVTVYWVNEANAAAAASKPKFSITELTAKKVIGLLYLTNELLDDSNAMDVWAQWAFSHEMTFVLENAIIAGLGADQPLGVLNSGALVTVTAESGQGSGTILSANVVNMFSRLWPPSRKNTLFLYNPELLPQLAQLSITVGSGGSIANLWQFAAGDSEWDSLCGIPAIPSEYCSVVGQPGDLILADFSRYVVAMRQSITADVSVHIKFESDQSAFRFVMRVDGTTIDKSPVVPMNASSPVGHTLSSFVVVSAR